MHKDNPTAQSDECLICLTPLLKDISFAHLVKRIPLCQHCLQKFDVIQTCIDFYHYPLTILYTYNDFFQSLLFQYKGLYDHALKDAFLCLFQSEFDNQYKDYIIVVAPSSQEDNELRGFAPVETIAQTFSSQIFNGLYKKEKYKQSDLSYQERKRVARRIDIRDGEKLKEKKVLILDDVITSGSTLHSCLLLVLAQEPQSVELLALSTKNIGRIEVC